MDTYERNMDTYLTNPLPIYEAVFYRRSVSTQSLYDGHSHSHYVKDSSTITHLHSSNSNNITSTNWPAILQTNSNEIFQYQNHVLIGNHLYYILRPLRPNHSDVGKFRLVLVQGTSKGRLRGIKLNQKTNIHTHIYSSTSSSAVSLYASSSNNASNYGDMDIRSTDPSGSPKQVGFPTAFMITLNGTDFWGREQTWELAMPSEEVCMFWAQALRKSRDSEVMTSTTYLSSPAKEISVSLSIGEREQLRALASKMCSSRGGVGVRKRFNNFKISPRSFVGSTAVKWIMKEKSCTVSQSLAIGNKMIVYGFMSHVSYEHLFCAKNILYRFSAEIDPLVNVTAAAKRDAGDMGDDSEVEEEDHNLLMNEMSQDAISLTLCQKDLKTANIAIMKTIKYANIFLDQLINIDGRFRIVLSKLKHYKRGFLIIAIVIILFASTVSMGIVQVQVNWKGEYQYGLASISIMTVFLSLISGALWKVLKISSEIKESLSVAAELNQHRNRFNVFQRRIKMAILKRDESDSEDDDAREDGQFDEDDAEEDMDYNTFFSKFVDEGDNTLEAAIINDSSVHDREADLPSTAAMRAVRALEAEDGDDIGDGSYSNREDEEEEEEAFDRILSEDDGDYPDDHRNLSHSLSSSPPRSSTKGFVTRVSSSSKGIFRRAVQPIGSPQNQGQPSPSNTFFREEFWPNDPILVKRSISMIGQRDKENPIQRESLLRPIRIHRPGAPEVSLIPIDNDFFVGKCYIWIAHLKDTPLQSLERKRKFQYIVQGQFKTTIPFSSIYTGHMFNGPFQQLPNKWIMRTALGLIKRLQPGLQVSVEGDNPYLVSPLASTCQAIVVSRPGSEPSLNNLQVKEDTTLLGPGFDSMTSKQRKMYFSKPQNLESHSFSPELVYTFDFYQHLLNFSTFQFDLGFMKYDFMSTLGARPIQVMSVVWNPIESNGIVPENLSYMYNFEIWHRKTFPVSQQPHEVELQQSAMVSPQSTGLSPAAAVAATREDSSAAVGESINTASKKKSKFLWLRASPLKPMVG